MNKQFLRDRIKQASETYYKISEKKNGVYGNRSLKQKIIARLWELREIAKSCGYESEIKACDSILAKFDAEQKRYREKRREQQRKFKIMKNVLNKKRLEGYKEQKNMSDKFLEQDGEKVQGLTEDDIMN